MKTLLQKIKDGGFDCAVVYADGSGFLLEKDPIDYGDEHKYQFDEIEEDSSRPTLEQVRSVYEESLKLVQEALGDTNEKYDLNVHAACRRITNAMTPVELAEAYMCSALGWVLGETQFGAGRFGEEIAESGITDAPQPAAVSSPQPSSSS